jgi:uncharacterized repeat protein (TIGR03847 family)
MRKWAAGAGTNKVGFVPHQIIRFNSPDRFVAGSVGEPGQRSFFLQAREGARMVTVLLEKEQVAALAERMDALLDEVVRRTAGQAPVPVVAPGDLDDNAPLEQPIEQEFRVGTLTLAWDGTDDQVVIEAFAAADDDVMQPDSEIPEDRDVLVVRISGAAARAFVKRAQALIAAGRPPCPLCALPLDPEGHICPRQNGYRRRD